MKNKKTNILIIIMLVLLLAMVGLVYLSIYEGFAFTSKQAAGELGDDYCIETKDFDVYYYNIRVDAEPAICGFNIVEKLVVGYKAVYDKEYRKALNYLCTYTMAGKNKHDDIPDVFAQLSEFAQSLEGNKVSVFKRPF